jgi:ubiquinone/menaquinone biosynthesis C-methylase UbiE
MSASSSVTNQPDQWSAQAKLYSNQAARLTELHGADLVTILKKDILQAKTILDVGCGTGAFAHAYMQQFPMGVPGQTLILSDLSEGMLEKAKETVVPSSDFQTKLVFQVEDGTKLDGIADDSIDLVVSLFGVFLIPDDRGKRLSSKVEDGKSNWEKEPLVQCDRWLF